ncbi:MAG: hypothetical protein L0H26_05045 [Microlunatus sp.]|nr:hypothetical protein [Microlunatus sp.]MDN5803943.1 hypothetical protein [Microlunatus sp.]
MRRRRPPAAARAEAHHGAGAGVEPGDDDSWLEVEHIDPETGELLGTSWQHLDADGEPISAAEEHPSTPHRAAGRPMVDPTGLVRRPRPPLRIGIVVPLSSLLGLDDCPAELADRSAMMPAEQLRQLITDTLSSSPGQSGGSGEVLFTRLLTDDGDRLLDTTELGRHPRDGLPKRSASGPVPADIRPVPCRPTVATKIITSPYLKAGLRQPTWTPCADATTGPKPSPGWPASETATPSAGPCPTPIATAAPTNPFRYRTAPAKLHPANVSQPPLDGGRHESGLPVLARLG